MLKQTVQYFDYNGAEAKEDLYFNLTRTEMTDLFPILPRMEAFIARVQASNAPDTLSSEDTLEMLRIIKELVERSYGQRSEDGKRFAKSPEIYKDFEESAAYDAFVFGLFQDPNKANAFMTGIMPRELLAQAQADQPVETVQTGGELNAVDETVPAWMRENREPTREELSKMSPAELQEAFRRRMEKSQ